MFSKDCWYKGCVETDRHTDDAPIIEPAVPNEANVPQKEIDTSSSAPAPAPPLATVPKAVPTPSLPPLPPVAEEEDDLSTSVSPGTTCRRKGCGLAFVSNEENRLGDGEGTRCTYHPAPVRPLITSSSYIVFIRSQPIFREGSKVCPGSNQHFISLIRARGICVANAESSSSTNSSRSRAVRRAATSFPLRSIMTRLASYHG